MLQAHEWALSQRLAQFEHDNATKPAPIQAVFRLDREPHCMCAGFGTWDNLALLVEMGYEVYTRPHNHQVRNSLLRRISDATHWTRVGDNAEMAAWPSERLNDCPYPADFALERFYTGKTLRYSVLLHFGSDAVTTDLPAWFAFYNGRQEIEAGIKEGKGVFQMHHLKVRQGPALWLQEQLAAFAANFVRWAAHWLSTQCYQEPAQWLEPVAASVRTLVQVAAYTPAYVEWLPGGALLSFTDQSIYAGRVIQTGHYGFMQFMADTVVLLHHRLSDRVSLREVRVVKYRGSRFAENEYPMVIGPAGIEIATLGAPGTGFRATKDRVSTGVERLDAMLKGGYFRGSCTLITGSPGTAKSTLAGAFVEAACRRGERALYVSFDEGAGEIIRNLESVNIYLEPHIQSGLLRIFSSRSEAKSAEEHLIEFRNLARTHEPTCVAIDPLSAMLKAGGHLSAVAVAQRLLYATKAQGITLLATSLLENPNPVQENTDLHISTVADNWLHLTYVIQAGERNRALTIVKSRGTGHSNQVRELVLSDAGITLADVYTAGGEVLMGTLRWEKEQAEKAARASALAERERQRQELQNAQAETAARIAALQREFEARQAAMAALTDDRGAADRQTGVDLVELRRRRRADENGSSEAA